MKKQLSEEQLLKLSPEEIFEQYKHLAEVTLIKMFANPRKFAQSIHMEYEDLLQFALIGLWEGSNSYQNSDKTYKLRSYLIRNIRWSIGRHVDRYTVIDRVYKSKKHSEDNMVSLISMHISPHQNEEDQTTYYDTVAADGIFNFNTVNTYPENVVISETGKKGIMNILKDEDKELVNLKLEKDLTLQEIADLYGISKQAISMKFKRIQKKVNEYLQKEAVAY